MKPVEAWYRGKVDRLMFAREQNKENLEALHLQEIRAGPGDLTLAEWERKMVEEEKELHGKRAYYAVFGNKDFNGANAENKE